MGAALQPGGILPLPATARELLKTACLCMAHGQRGSTGSLGSWTALLPREVLNGRPFLYHPTPDPTRTHPRLPGKHRCPQSAGAAAGLNGQGTKLPSPGLLAAG